MAGNGISNGTDIADAFARAIADGMEKGMKMLLASGKLDNVRSEGMKDVFTGGGKSISEQLRNGGGGGVFTEKGGGLESLFGSIGGKGGVGEIMDMLGGGKDIPGILDTVLGGASAGPLGLAWSAYKVFDRFTKKATNAPMAEVKKIHDDSVNVLGDNLGVLMGSEIFGNASFSSRNINGDVLRKFASARSRTAPEVTVNIKPSREFDAISDSAWVRSSKRHEMGGIPMRTNFTHG